MPPEEPQGHGHKFLAVSIILLAVLVGGGIFLYNRQVADKNFPTTEEMRNIILQDSMLSFDQTSVTVTSNKESLPQELQDVIPADATDLKVELLQDNLVTKGYRITFGLKKNMHAYFLELRNNLLTNGWTQLTSRRSDLINVYEADFIQYSLRAETTFVSDEVVSSTNAELISESSQESLVVMTIKQK